MSGFFAGGFAKGLGAGLNQERQRALDMAHLEQSRRAQELAQRRMDAEETAQLVAPWERIATSHPESFEDAMAAADAIRSVRAGKPVKPIATAPTTPDVALFQSLEAGDLTPNKLGTLDEILAHSRGRISGVQKAIRDRAYALERQHREAQEDRMREQTDLQREQLKQTGELRRLALQNQAQAAKVRAAGSPGGAETAAVIADAIESGQQPPDLKGLYRFGAPVRAELAKRGYDLTTATKDWQAVQRHLATLNGPQQDRPDSR